MLLSLLLGLLGVFIEWLFKSWLATKTNPLVAGAKPISFPDAKPLFLAKVKRRFWYGPGRIEMASSLYDKAAARFLSSEPEYMLDLSTDEETAFKKLAKNLVKDLVP